MMARVQLSEHVPLSLLLLLLLLLLLQAQYSPGILVQAIEKFKSLGVAYFTAGACGGVTKYGSVTLQVCIHVDKI
jgi:hypothetical protein